MLRIEEKKVTAALAKMKNGKPPGPDNLPPEIWKIAEGAGTLWLPSFSNEMIAEWKLPNSWTTNTTVPIYRFGRVRRYGKLCSVPIILCSLSYDEDLRTDSGCLTPQHHWSSMNQYGLVKNCSTTDDLHVVRLLTEKRRKKEKTLHLALLDLDEAFDGS
ncbi:hypothetical protein Y032_0237g3262 [Ancylostoma ceylanicum]|uniref:Reverse transcriptase domain-containing protein n=1 Tax=Ancylostoma ceylanicum TaxID=53326 RepID=A0A016SFL3_9BILA|nr:hypothetical protein Y032_0237g3262 [Ancylostoma ceylanicum]